MTHRYKKSAIPLTGYLYQNLIGLNILCDWLDDPSLFEWVKFEADGEDAPQGLDDVVAMQADGLVRLIQVKFTVDADSPQNELTWTWLLAHKPTGRSLVQKWSDALFELSFENVGETALVTNRRPDREFADCLESNRDRVQPSFVSALVWQELTQQLGGDERVEKFLKVFEFRHSYQGYEALQTNLIDRLIPRHTNSLGWLALGRESIDWAVIRSHPPPKGRITLDLVKGTLHARRPMPLLQSFLVPDGYEPPSQLFADQFVESLRRKSVVVLWGSPGQGKSTFLSHVCNELDRIEMPYVRHHYFLSITDTSERFTLANVAGSLMAQISLRHFEFVQELTESAEHLRSWLEACAAGYKQVGKRFIIVVDGLDHVWRENDHDRRPIDSLFSALFPVPDNVSVVVGTQRVGSDQLPALFQRFVDNSCWEELPLMSLTSTRNWLEAQYDATRFELPDDARARHKGALTELANALQRISGGHPLVLTYCFESLARTKRILDVPTIEALDLTPDGDIKKYYSSLWTRLSFNSKDALHLLADAGFIWPPLGLESCLGIGSGDLTEEIGHLLHNSEAGQIPFHGSLFAFVRDDPSHLDRITRLQPKVIEWLASAAPPFHRWGWLWLYEHRGGSSRKLLEFTTRAWVVESLSLAYPREQIELILAEAETTAFLGSNFPTSIRLRWLKTRLQNGPEFQLDDFDELYACALQLTPDDYPLKILASSIQTASISRLHLLGTQYLLVGRKAEAVECLIKMRMRINDQLKVGAFDQEAFRAIAGEFIELAAATREFSAAKVVSILMNFPAKDALSLFDAFLRELSQDFDLAPLMEFVCHAIPLGLRRELELACMRLAGRLAVSLHEWPEFVRFHKHPMSHCWRLLYAPVKPAGNHFCDFDASLDLDRNAEIRKPETQAYLHCLFFAKVARALLQNGAPCPLAPPVYRNRAWLSIAVKNVVALGDFAGALLARGESPAFAFPFRVMESVAVPETYEEMSDYIPFKKALSEIATDLFLLTKLRSGMATVPSAEWQRAIESPHFSTDDWYERYASQDQGLVDRSLIVVEIDKRIAKTAAAVSPFNERTESYVHLCRLATRLHHQELANKLLRTSFACVVSYGWRKDPALSYSLNAIEALADRDPVSAIQFLKRVAPIFAKIDEMAEASGSRQSDLAGPILRLMPNAFAAYYRHCLLSSEWYVGETVFTELLATHALNGPQVPLVTAAVWDGNGISVLRKRAADGDADALQLFEANVRRFGLRSKDADAEAANDLAKENSQVDIDVSQFLPSEVLTLLEKVKGKSAYTSESRILKQWYEHWESQRRGIELLRGLEPLLSETHISSRVSELFDLAFDTSIALEGKQKAYRWIVAAQVHRRGWNEHFDRDGSANRFEKVAQHYKGIWKQFILDTTKPGAFATSDALVIPHICLVRFLLAVGEISEAKSVVATMVDTILEDFAEQPLSLPAWLSLVPE